jgi:hypothetical protein
LTTPSVAVDAQGTAYVVWNDEGAAGSDGGVVYLRTHGRRTGWSAPIVVSTHGRSSSPQVQLAANGDVVVSWWPESSAPDELWMAREHAGVWTGGDAPVIIQPDPTNPVVPDAVNASPDGRIYAAWQVCWNASCEGNQVYAAELDPGALTWTTPQKVDVYEGFDGDHATQILPNGTISVEDVDEHGDASWQGLFVRTAPGSWTLSTVGPNEYYQDGCEAVAQSGSGATIGFAGYPDGRGPLSDMTLVFGSGTLAGYANGPFSELAWNCPSDGLRATGMAVNDQGDVELAEVENDALGRPQLVDHAARGGVLSPGVQISRASERTAGPASLAITDEGAAIVAWKSQNRAGTLLRPEAAVRSAPGAPWSRTHAFDAWSTCSYPYCSSTQIVAAITGRVGVAATIIGTAAGQRIQATTARLAS